jgi:hypothetical protein
MRWRTFGSCLVVVALSAGPARSQAPDEATRTAARALGTAGVEAFEAGDMVAASDKLEKAYQLLKVPSLGLWSARALEKRGLLLEALARYLEASSTQVPGGEATVQHKAQVDAEREGAALKVRVPRVVISLEGAEPSEVTLTIDGKSVSSAVIGSPRLLNPGAHVVEVTRGNDRARAKVTAVEGKELPVLLRLASDGPTSADPAPVAGTPGSVEPPGDDSAAGRGSSIRPTLGWVSIGVGAAGLAVGIGTGLSAKSKRAALDDSGVCVGDSCPSSKQGEVDSLNTLRTISTIGFVAGGVLAATGVTLLLTAPSKSGASAALQIAPTSLELRGRF